VCPRTVAQKDRPIVDQSFLGSGRGCAVNTLVNTLSDRDNDL
jgi:hypothetical protein